MKLGGRLSAAIEILSEIENRHRPAAAALSDWARSHRFAGSGDRAAIGNIVYDALRRRSSLASLMADDSPRAIALGVAGHVWKLTAAEIEEACGDRFGPGAMTPKELSGLDATLLDDVPPCVAGDYPEWLDDDFKAAFGDRRAEEGAGLANRAPVDLRTNTLKTTPEKLLASLQKFNAVQGPWLETSVRIPPPVRDGRNPNVEAEPAHGKGWFEIQDTGSQIAAALAGAAPGLQVGDVCAGAGGKTLALAAAMENTGQVHAWDNDKHRLRPIFERLSRSGARNVQVIPADEPERLNALQGGLDVVFVDAPCSGSGSWRRKPDAKWRLTEKSLNQRLSEQAKVLENAKELVKPGGRLVYVTCSVLPRENTAQISAFLDKNPQFEALPYADVWRETISSEPPASADGNANFLLLTPSSHDTDGFFIAVLQRLN